MIRRVVFMLSSTVLIAACGHSPPAGSRPSAASLLDQARVFLSETTSFHAHVWASLQPYGGDGKPIGYKTATDFNGWVAGEKASGESRVADTSAPVIRIGERLYTQWTPEYLHDAGPDLIAKCQNRWIVSDRAATPASLAGAVTTSQFLRVLRASDTPRDIGDTRLEGQPVTRLRYTSDPGVTITLYLTRAKKPRPARIELSAPTKFFAMTTELDRYGQAPPIVAPANAVQLCP